MAAKTRRSYSEADKERFAEQRREQLEAMQRQIVEASTRLVAGDQWQTWLRFAGTFHAYSFANQLLIWSQRPDASLVAGYRAWQAKGRQVQKGETGIRIMAPVLVRTEVLDEAGNPVLDETGKPKKTSRIVGVKPATCFDVTQTAGEPIPERPRPQLLKGQAPEGLWEAVAQLIEDRGYQVRRGDCGTANGITHFGDRTITVRPDVDDCQATKTLLHEAGHVLLHEPEGAELLDSTGLCRGEMEVEAESVAFLVANAHQMDTSDYTFAYVASWASNALHQADQDVTLAEIITKTGQRVVKAAHTILDATQPEQTIDTTSELAAEVTAQIAEDRQTIPEVRSAEAGMELVADQEPRIQARDVDPEPAREPLVLDPDWDDEERLARAMLSTVIEPGDPGFLNLLHEAGNAAYLVADLRGTPPDRLPAGWQRNLTNINPESLINLTSQHGLRYIMPTDPEWPPNLHQLTNCPPLNGVQGAPIGLWVAGDHQLNQWLQQPVTITGARAATNYGETVAADLAQQLAGRHTIVSSEALGIDTAVHRAAIVAGGRMLAVHAGVNSPLPLGHWQTREHLAAGDMMISEIGPRPVGRRDFLARSRLLAGMSQGTVIIEAPLRGTALTTAAWSNHLGKPTMAAPGPATSAMSVGCHTLIRNQQADLVTDADQITTALTRAAAGRPEQAPHQTAGVALQDAAPAPDRRQVMDVFRQYNGTGFDTFTQARDATGWITAAAVIGAIHSVRTYDPGSIVDDEVQYLTEAYETIVFENQGELDRWADINGLRAVEGRNDNDILTSIDPYEHPHAGLIEVHDLYIQRPATVSAAQRALEDRAIEHRAVQDTLLAAFPATASAARPPTTPIGAVRRQTVSRPAVPAIDR